MWQNHSSDYLDGTLPESAKREADDHLEGCKDCSEHYKHYRLIVSSIASQARAPLPSPIRKAPLSSTLPRADSSRMSVSRWERVPWYLRTTIEGVGIVLVILVGISSAPKIRSLYEKNLERTLSDFKESFNTTETIVEGTEPNLPTAPGKPVASLGTEGDELSGEDEAGGEEANISVGRSQLWRFTLKTVSPDELRPQVIKALTSLGIAANTPGLQGIKVPGGIEFDLLLSQSLVPDIKHSLQKIAPPLPVRGNEQRAGETDSFSWYKVKSRRKVPEGKSQVVIWLSQPN